MKKIKKYSPAKKFFWLLAIFIVTAGFLFSSHVSVSRAVDPPAKDAKVLDLNLTSSTKNEKNMDYITNPSLTSGDCSYIYSPIMCPLMDVLRLMAWLLGVAGSVFAVAADATVLREFLSGPQIYLIWSQIRDFLNVAFILVLLFSAFSTIFQVEKYGYKKILRHLILMALLVNFSYPIARFIIDLSNVLMYTIAQNLLPAGGPNNLFAIFSNHTKLGQILGADTTGSVTSLLVGIIFTFILAITLLAIALLFVVRMIALALIIMFSPVAFTATIVSGVDGGFASKWWGYLFKYSFFGPVMLFMLYISTQLMQATKGVSAALQNTASAQAGGLATIVWSMSTYSLPIIILWIGMGIAQSMGIEGAGAVMGQAKKWATSGITAIPRAGWWSAKKAANVTGIPGGLKNRWDYFKKTGFTGTDATEERAARLSAGLGGDRNAYENLRMKRAKEAGEKHDTANMSEADLKDLKRDGNQYEKAAASLGLASMGKADATDLSAMKSAGFDENSQVFKQLQSKIKTYDPAAAFAHISDGTERAARLKEHLDSNQFDASKLSAAALAGTQGEELIQLAFSQGAMTNDDLEKLGKKSKDHKKNMTTSLGKLADRSTDHTNKDHKAIHSAYLAQTGNVHSSVLTAPPADRAAWNKALFSGGNKDTLKRMDATSIGNSGREMLKYVDSGKIKDILKSLPDDDARKALVTHIKHLRLEKARRAALTPNELDIANMAETDPYLGNLTKP